MKKNDSWETEILKLDGKILKCCIPTICILNIFKNYGVCIENNEQWTTIAQNNFLVKAIPSWLFILFMSHLQMRPVPIIFLGARVCWKHVFEAMWPNPVCVCLEMWGTNRYRNIASVINWRLVDKITWGKGCAKEVPTLPQDNYCNSHPPPDKNKKWYYICWYIFNIRKNKTKEILLTIAWWLYLHWFDQTLKLTLCTNNIIV